MANILTAPAETMPGPSNNRNAAWSIPMGAGTPAPITGQTWPRGSG